MKELKQKKNDIETRITRRELFPVSTSTNTSFYFFVFFCPVGQISFKMCKH